MKDTPPHILNAATNLLGFCFVVLTSLKVLHLGHATAIDELTAVTIVFLMASIVFSFLSLRKQHNRLERVAEICFLFAIGGLFITTVLISFNLIV